MNRLEHMTALVRTVEAGGFTAASRLLGVSPSAVSKHIAKLEDHLRVRLFNRTSRSLQLTAEGRLYYERSREVLALVEDAEALVSSRAQVPRGLLRVHCPPVFATSRLAQLSRMYLDRHPNVQLEYVLGNEPVDLVSSGIDVDIRRGHLPDSSLVARGIASSRWLVCAAPDYLARRGEPRLPQDLRKHDCINISVRPQSGRWPFDVGGVTEHVRTGGIASSNSGEMVRRLAIAGVGIVRLLEFHVEEDLRAGRLVRLFADQPEQTEVIHAVYFKRKNLNARVRTYVEFLAARLR
ncbi:MAG: LysR family transcriptional regulator [Lautropia sp.]